ncbi:MAG: YHS domain-containing protein [Planctomycetota bacterium]|jgi:YHS domain-containing protein
MNSKKKQISTLIILSLLLLGLVVLAGCKKKPEPAPPTETAAEAVSAAIEQTTCPVMGLPINKSIFTEYKGKKVYFCCAGCPEKFKADPEKYVAKLPQFKD